MKVLHTIRETPPNTRGVCDLTSGDASYLAYPGSSATGQLQIFDAANLASLTTIAAHDGPLASVRFTPNGDMVATASEKGTVIRVFAVPAGERLFEFRRGVKRCVTIYSLAFSQCGQFVSSSSNTETVHVFNLDGTHKHNAAAEHTSGAPQAHRVSEEGAGWMDYVSRTASQYLPAQMTDILQQDRSFATARLPTAASGATSGGTAAGAGAMAPGLASPAAAQSIAGAAAHCDKRTQLAITSGRGGQLRLMVASTDGYLYIYNLDTKIGGECALLRQHRFIEVSSDPDGAGAQSGLGREPAKAADGAGDTPGARHMSYACVAESTPGAGATADPIGANTALERCVASALSSVPRSPDRIGLNDSAEFPPISHSAN